MKKLKGKLIIFFVTLFRIKNKYLLDHNDDFILDSKYLPIKPK